MSEQYNDKNIPEILKGIESILKKVVSDNKTILELNNSMHQLMEDISKKNDLLFNTDTIKKPKLVPVDKPESIPVTKSKKIPKKVETSKPNTSVNVLMYFKNKWIENPSKFDNIFDEKQSESLFIEHSSQFESKIGKNKLKSQACILYKYSSDLQKSKIKEMKLADEEASIVVNNDNDIEEEHSN